MRVHWTNKALNDLLSIYEYIESSSPGYADQTVDRLTRRTEQIEVFPESGRTVPEDVLITKDNRPLARLTAPASPEEKKHKRQFGSVEGEIWMSDDFDKPLEEFREYR